MAILTQSKEYRDGVDIVAGQDITDTQDTAINANNVATTAMGVADRVDAVAADLEQKVASGYFKGEQGPAGPQGIQGPEGPRGIAGKDGAGCYVAGVATDINFSSDPQTQINTLSSSIFNLQNAKADKDLSNVSNLTLKNKALSIQTLWSGSYNGDNGVLTLSSSLDEYNFIVIETFLPESNEAFTFISPTYLFREHVIDYWNLSSHTPDKYVWATVYYRNNNEIGVYEMAGSLRIIGVYGV